METLLFPVSNPYPHDHGSNAEVMSQKEYFTIQNAPKNGNDGNGVSD
jgi:hypothetical protein